MFPARGGLWLRPASWSTLPRVKTRMGQDGNCNRRAAMIIRAVAPVVSRSSISRKGVGGVRGARGGPVGVREAKVGLAGLREAKVGSVVAVGPRARVGSVVAL